MMVSMAQARANAPEIWKIQCVTRMHEQYQCTWMRTATLNVNLLLLMYSLALGVQCAVKLLDMLNIVIVVLISVQFSTLLIEVNSFVRHFSFEYMMLDLALSASIEACVAVTYHYVNASGHVTSRL